MSGSTRAFVAIALPATVAEVLQSIQDRLAPETPGVRWTGATSGFHLTLAFLGDVPDAELPALSRAMAMAAEPAAPLSLRLEGLGAFPSPSRPRVLWAGIGGPGRAELTPLRSAIAAALGTLGHPPADDRFRPHVTLGRIRADHRRPPDWTRLLERFAPWAGPDFEVAEVGLFASRVSPGGPAHATLAHALLKGQKPPIRP